MDRAEGLTQRKLQGENSKTQLYTEDETRNNENNLSDDKLTLAESVFLLGLQDKEGYISFWNDRISTGLRGCILVELAFRGRIDLENISLRRKSLLTRTVIVKNDACTGDAILDEALKHIKETKPESVSSWIELLNGESWNPLKSYYQLKKVRTRTAKSLVEKGVLTTGKRNYLIFDMTVHPLMGDDTKCKLLKDVQDAVLSKWPNDPHRIDNRMLALLLLAEICDVLYDAFETLSNQDYDVATRRVCELTDLDFEQECFQSTLPQLVWAVFAHFIQ